MQVVPGCERKPAKHESANKLGGESASSILLWYLPPISCLDTLLWLPAVMDGSVKGRGSLPLWIALGLSVCLQNRSKQELVRRGNVSYSKNQKPQEKWLLRVEGRTGTWRTHCEKVRKYLSISCLSGEPRNFPEKILIGQISNTLNLKIDYDSAL